MALLFDLLKQCMEIFMDDFSIFGPSFLTNRCRDTNLVLNWEKCQFMVKECIVLRREVYQRRIEVDPAKVEFITKLPLPVPVKAVRSFLDCVDFYKRFVKNFFKIAKPMTNLLAKDKNSPMHLWYQLHHQPSLSTQLHLTRKEKALVCGDNMVKRCILIQEAHSILTHYHYREVGGHFRLTRTAYKVLQSGFY
ncbi:Retrovirus-related Pol polyprotein, partial [Mucuna pruriens]